MGVNNFNKLVETIAPESVEEFDFVDFSGSLLAVDASPQIYKFVIAIRGNNRGEDIITKNGDISSHIYGIFHKIFTSIIYGILTVWVFDGVPPELKRKTLVDRRKTRKNAQKLLESGEYDDVNHKIRLSKKAFSLSEKYVNEVKELLDILGIPYVQALGEAEAQCAALNRSGKIDGVVTEDWDALTFGSHHMIKNFTNKKKIKRINLCKLLHALDITHDKFVDLCILLGTDYCPGIKGLGAINIYKEFKSVDSVEELINKFEKLNEKTVKVGKKPTYIIPNNFLEKYEEAKDYYNNVEILDPHDPLINLAWKEPDREKLIDFLCNRFELKKNSVISKIDTIMGIYRKYKDMGKLSSEYYRNVMRYHGPGIQSKKYGFTRSYYNKHKRSISCLN